MKVVALVSGGKDSCYSIHLCGVHGHEVVALANLLPPDNSTDELDSYMYQTVGHQLVAAYATCTGLPLYRRRIHGTSSSQGLSYSATAGDEVEDLFLLLAYIKECHPDLQAVASGAIASDYQRLRVESVCSRLGLVSLGYLWHQPQDQLLSDMIANNIEAVLVKVAAIGLDPYKHLGKSIRQIQPLLRSLRDRFGCNVCGEGGEYETLTLDCPAFEYGRIVLDNWEVVLHSPDSIAPVGVMHPTAFHIEPKQQATRTIDQNSQKTSDQLHEISQEALDQPGAAVVIEVPDDWQPQRADASTHHNSSSLTDTEAAAAATWEATLQTTVSASHIHVLCSAKCGPRSPDEPPSRLSDLPPLPPPAAVGSFTAADAAAALDVSLAAVAAQLSGLGLQWLDSCFVHLYLADMAHFGTTNEVYCRHLPQINPPSRACVQVPLPADCPVMLDVLFARPAAVPVSAAEPDSSHHQQQQQQLEAPERRVLHVQSISSWAPSCIGPYSQATACNGLIYMAGQIPLDPASMTLAAPSPAGMAATIATQTWRTLCSCQAVAVAVRSCFASAALGLTVYLSQECADAGGRDIVQAAMDAVCADRNLLDCLDVPAVVLQVAAAVESSNKSASADVAAVQGSMASGSSVSSSCGSDDCDEAVEQVIDDYLKPPTVMCRIKPAVVYVTVPALPRGALLEVQPVLKDLTLATTEASSSSGEEMDQAVGGATVSGSTEKCVASSVGTTDAEDGMSTDGTDAGLGPVHVTCDTGGSSWRRTLVHLLCSGAATECRIGCAKQATAAGRQVVAAIRQHNSANRSTTDSVEVCTVRCWYCSAVGGCADSNMWQQALVASIKQQCRQQQPVAVQFVPVTNTASDMQPGGCWAVLEAYSM